MQKNLEQLRAAHALQHVGDLKQNDVAKLPALIINNGLLAAAAFATDEKRGPMKAAMNAVADHLAELGLINKVERENGISENPDAEAMLEDLAERPDAAPLQRATAEALAYLSYLKRFAATEREDRA